MSDLIERMRSLEQDHEPDGWPAVQMRDIRALCDLVEVERACGAGPVGYTNWAQLAYIKTVGEGAVYSDTDHGCDIALYAHPLKSDVLEDVIKAAVERFLCWKLPEDFSPDGGVSFDRAYEYDSPHWPVGTNILTAEQAEQMFMECLAPIEPQPEGDGWIKCSERLPTEADEDFEGLVWLCWPHRDLVERVTRRTASFCEGFWWMPTGLKRPQPPKEGA